MTDSQDRVALVNDVAEELLKCRQRGIERLDVDDKPQRRLDLPQLELLASVHGLSGAGSAVLGRIAAIKQLLRDKLVEFEVGAHKDEAALIRDLIFGGETGFVRYSAGDLLDNAAEKRDVADSRAFRVIWTAAVKSFANFLVESLYPESKPQTPPKTEPRPTVAKKRWAFYAVAALLAIAGVVWLITQIPAGSQGSGSHDPSDRKTASEPQRSPSSGRSAGPTHKEIAGARVGTNTYKDPRKLGATGPDIPFLQEVDVECKILAPTMDSVTYWYKIATAPWDGYFAPTNSFLNGDPPEGPYSHDVDNAVPDCSPDALPI
ncbi:hypothetical protein [Actinokineospora sp. HUAS TT18]|uniref:hypothetical protein n=1 Tax=Actinokineospora sp. HUAS TT18 TaxID=3447451 RepID=UPI003F51DD62